MTSYRMTAAILAMWGAAGDASAAQPCELLASLKLPDTAITLAEHVAAGAFVLPTPAGAGAEPVRFTDPPAFCRVAATIRPTKDSDIKIEIWMPADGWNGKFRGQGNGGFAGSIGCVGLGAALKQPWRAP